jgi:hypothetical protein
MGNCQPSNKFTCGVRISSTCVPWEGPVLTSFDVTNLPDCAPNMDEIVIELDKALKVIQTTLTIAKIKSTTSYTVNPNLKWYDLATYLLQQLNTISGSLSTLQQQFNDFNAGNLQVPVDMSCFSTSCANGNYSLGVHLTTIYKTLCSIISEIKILDPNYIGDASLVYQPQ